MGKLYSGKNVKKIQKIRHPESLPVFEQANMDARLSLLETGVETLAESVAPLGSLKWSLTELDDLAWLPFGSDAVLITEYQGIYDKYVGNGTLDLIEDINVADGKPASTVDTFYATPPISYYLRSAIKETFITTNIDAGNDYLTLTSHRFQRDGTPIQVYTDGSLTGSGMSLNTTYYIRVIDSNNISLHTSEDDAITDTSPVSLTQTGSGNHWVSNVGITISDAGQGHHHTLSTGSVGILTAEDTNVEQPGSGSTAQFDVVTVDDPITDGVNGTPRTTNETRGKTLFAYGYIRVLGYAANPLSTFSNNIYYELQEQIRTLRTDVANLIDYTDNSQENDIINGALPFWQRGTSYPSIASSTYFADRWIHYKVGSAVYDITEDSDIPDRSVTSSISMECTTASAMSASDYVQILQRIEGYTYSKYESAGYGILSFEVKSSLPGVYCVNFRSGGSDASYIKEYSINNANQWTPIQLLLPMNHVSGTWYYDNNTGLQITWMLSAGSSSHNTPDTWHYSNVRATSNQVNHADTIGNTFKLAKVKFEPGKIVSPFVPYDHATELVRCQRYYEKTYDLNIVPGSASNYTGMINNMLPAAILSGQIMEKDAPFTTRKRTAPTVVVYSPITGAAGSVHITGVDRSVTTSKTERGILSVTNNSGVTWGDQSVVQYHFTADAEL